MSKLKYLFTAQLVLFVSFFANAQTADATTSFFETYQLEIVLGLAAVVAVVALLSLIAVLYALKTMLTLKTQKQAQLDGVERIGFWRKFWNKMNDAVPIAKEHEILTDHTYDGIKELDNRLPPWWLYGFYVSIIFSIIYVLHFHVFKSGDLQAAEYEKEMKTAEAQVEAYLASLDNLIDESNVEFTKEAVDLSAGQELFNGKCAACHGMKGEGGVGPNLTDKYWIHGGDVKAIFKTIKYGVPAKGMISWKAQLSPKEMQQVASYIYTLEGTNPPNAKEPQGELFERSADTEEDSGEES
ncbi:cbb3-type cytochrome c oxidase N-terminal domain-containing protein [Marinoscillum sp. MHG1-6]|uniref:cbb3-type cytochrome c oxidase N-terminal domain-containing protein n=1 Tax=Marinoscillum sp. MHG1-6 TaxID=2959627 RepID=UPI0021581750|nr:cbb3-type cytochrome c oxidase N-terminal domain-containing protein [Marinoscillum sp. MHG1-6]